jgi:hypothetical protein
MVTILCPHCGQSFTESGVSLAYDSPASATTGKSNKQKAKGATKVTPIVSTANHFEIGQTPHPRDVSTLSTSDMFAHFKQIAPMMDVAFVTARMPEVAAMMPPANKIKRADAMRAFQMFRQRKPYLAPANEALFWALNDARKRWGHWYRAVDLRRYVYAYDDYAPLESVA